MNVFQRDRKRSLAEQMGFLLSAAPQGGKNPSERSLTAFRATTLDYPQNSASMFWDAQRRVTSLMSHLALPDQPCDNDLREVIAAFSKNTPPILTGGVQDYVGHAGRVLGGAHGVLPMEGVARPKRPQWNA